MSSSFVCSVAVSFSTLWGGLSENNAISPTLTLIERDVYGRGKDCYFFVFVSGLVSSISWFVLFVFIYSTVKEEDERKEKMIKKKTGKN